MKKKIIAIIESYEDTLNMVEYTKYESIANDIIQLKIECPDTEEIKAEAQRYAPLNGWEKDAFKAGANYIKNEIARRNQ